MNINLNRLALVVIFGLAGSFLAQGANAQNKFDSTVHKVERKTGEAAHAVANKTASTAVKGESLVTDHVYKGKEGPNGQTVYIDKKDRKYFVDDKGKKVYLKKSQIRDKKGN